MNNIFKECDFKLSHTSMQLYQNILQYHFSDKEELISNLNSFRLESNQIPNFKKFKNHFYELQKANLVEIKDDYIIFKNVWQKHLNLARMTKIVNNNTLANEYMDIMFDSQQLIEAVAMKLKIKKEDVHQLLKMFFSEQQGIGKTYTSEIECRKHFIYWSQFNQSKIVKNTVVSKAKILGI